LLLDEGFTDRRVLAATVLGANVLSATRAWLLRCGAKGLCSRDEKLAKEGDMRVWFRYPAVVAIVAVGFANTSDTAELNPAALIYQRPDQIKWNPPTASGAQNAVLVGDPSKPGLYIVMNKWLKGDHFSRPHFHPNDRFITVLGGTWWVGSGTTFDPAHCVPMPTGTFVTHYGKQVHWDGAKGEDASLLIVGDGPGTSTAVEATPGPLTGLDPAAVVPTLPDQFKWRDPTGAAGLNQVVLHGDPSTTGLYVTLNRFKPGNFSRPHFHPSDRFITVVKGTWWVATGATFDKESTHPMPAGSFVTHFAKQVHWDGAKNEEAWVLIVGEGPGTVTLVDTAN
jgi:quercetin dioxygenase-like cupin family protein